MSELYQDLALTQYPENLDTFTTWLNITASDGPLIAQYQAAMEAGNTVLANQILAQIPNATQKIIKATDLNKITQAILAVERFYKTDIEPYIQTQQESWLNTINRFSYQGVWASGTSYLQNNIVSYTNSGLQLLFLATANPPLGTPPTNTSYWRVLTIQGQQGTSGPGLTYMQEWNSSTTYNTNDAVTYGGGLWMALQPSTNVQPGTNDEFWKLVIPIITTTYPIQATQPTAQSAGDLWFNTQDNPTRYYYLEPLDNPITDEMIPEGYQAYGVNGEVLDGQGPLPIGSGGTSASTSQEALAALGSGVRPRLGINMDFTVNQRGKQSYTTGGYTLDGWRATFIGLTSGSVDFNDPGVTMTAAGNSDGYLDIAQYFEENLLGKTMTFSVLYDDGTFLTITGTVPSQVQSSDTTVASKQNDKTGIWIRINKSGLVFTQIRVKPGNTISPVAAKPEEGEGQTLAYEDSDGVWHRLPQPEDGDYGMQLAKCQRYLQVIAAGKGGAYFPIGYGMAFSTTAVRIATYLPVVMRSIIPTIQFSGKFQLVHGSTIFDVADIKRDAMNSLNLVSLNAQATGLTLGDLYQLRAGNDVTAEIIISAEL